MNKKYNGIIPMDREKRIITINIVHFNTEISWRESFEQLSLIYQKEKEKLDQMLVFLGKTLPIEESTEELLRINILDLKEYIPFSYEKSFFRLKSKILMQFQNKLTLFYAYANDHIFNDESLIARFIQYLSITLEIKHVNKIVLINE